MLLGVYPNEYMMSMSTVIRDFIKLHCHRKKDYLTIEDITDVKEDFGIKYWGKYDYLYVESNTLLLAVAATRFCNNCIKTYELDPAYFLSAPGLKCLKKTEVKMEL